MSNANQLVELLTRKGLTIGSVESFTGGLFAKTMTDVSGASKCFKGALVTYSEESKIKLLGMSKEFIDANGLVSWGVAKEMAIKGRRILGTDICVSFTGNAGPEVCPGEASVGEVYLAIYYLDKVWPIPLHLEYDREKVREIAVNSVIDTVISILKR